MPKTKNLKKLSPKKLAKRSKEYQTMYYWMNNMEKNNLVEKLEEGSLLSQAEQYSLRKQIADAEKAAEVYETAKRNEKRWWKLGFQGNSKKINKAENQLEKLRSLENKLDAKINEQTELKKTDNLNNVNWENVIIQADQLKNPGYLDKMEVLLAKANNPKLPLADLLDPEAYKDEKAAARNKWTDALRDFDGENFERLGKMLTDCQKILGDMDYRREAFLAVGQKNLLSPEDARKCMYAPENQDKLNDFFVAASGLADVFEEKAVKAVEKGNQDRGITPEEKTSFERAKDALTNAFRYEREWKAEREHYAVHGEHCIDNAETARNIMVKKSLRDVQRERLLLDGKLGGQTHINTKVIAGAEKKTMEFFATKPSKGNFDFRQIGENLKLKDVFERNETDCAVDQTVLCGVKASVMDVSSAKMNEAGIIERDITKGKLLNDFEKVGNSVFNDLSRDDTLNHTINIYGLKEGYDLKELTDNTELKMKVGREFLEFVRENTMTEEEINTELKNMSEETRKKVENIRKFYEGAIGQIKDLKIPDVDFSDPKQQAAAASDMADLAAIMVNLSQSVKRFFESPWYNKELIDVKENVLKATDLSNALEFSNSIMGKPAMGSTKIFSNRLRESILGSEIGGHKLGELANNLPPDRDAGGYHELIYMPTLLAAVEVKESEYFKKNLMNKDMIGFAKEVCRIADEEAKNDDESKTASFEQGLENLKPKLDKLRKERKERRENIQRPENAERVDPNLLQTASMKGKKKLHEKNIINSRENSPKKEQMMQGKK